MTSSSASGISLTLGSQSTPLEVALGTTPQEILKTHARAELKQAVACKVDGEMWDLTRPLEADCHLEAVARTSDDGLELLRHDAAHVMAQAVQQLYPNTQVTIGPAIENGFYYDFVRDEPFSSSDLEAIEERMQQIVRANHAFEREVWERDDAIAFFRDKGETYKAELIDDIPEGETITLYRQGDFIDLCRGPHLPSTGMLRDGFKLMRVAGAYWRGDAQNAMLQRIYGTAWQDKKALRQHLNQLEEAERRDHRKLAVAMDLFHLEPSAPGAIFWHANGRTILTELEAYMRRLQRQEGYEEISTPIMMEVDLWKRSGHWEKFGDNMFTSMLDDDRMMALKPMNCPGCVRIFANRRRSYRELPVKFSEFGTVHRNEASGTLHGLLRVRQFTQDDAHVFCTQTQLEEQVIELCQLIMRVYKDFGFTEVSIKFSDRPAKRVGSDEVWDASEAALEGALKAGGFEYELNPGEGAFYGPKLEFVLHDAIGRHWQCGTVQVDLNLPERLGATYVTSDDTREYPVMIHRALFGSLERFIGILVEQYAGTLPMWLAPRQLAIVPIADTFGDYAAEMHKAATAAGIRCEIDDRNESLSYRLRDLSKSKVSTIAVIGEREVEEQTVTLRELGSKQQTSRPLNETLAYLAERAAPPA